MLIIATVKWDSVEALFEEMHGQRDVLASEALAMSYHWQLNNNLEEARQSAYTATTIDPSFGFAWARLAELEFSFGRIDLAKRKFRASTDPKPGKMRRLTHCMVSFSLRRIE